MPKPQPAREIEEEALRTLYESAPAVGPVETESLEGGVEIIDGLLPEWRALCEEGPCQDPFFRPEWTRAHLRSFEPDARLRIVTVREGGRLRLVLPLIQERARLRGFPVRKLRAAAGVHSCRFDLIVGNGDPRSWLSALWEHLQAHDGWDVIELRDVQEGGVGERLLASAKESGNHAGTWESMRTPFVRIAGAPFEQLLGKTSSHFRANLRRRMKKLQSRGKVELRRIDHADAEALERFYALERDGWKGRGGTAIDSDRTTRRFYDEIARWAASEGMLSLYALELDGIPVAMHYGLEAGGRYFLPKPAFAHAHRACSPGQLLMHEVLRDCSERGLSEFDFLGPWMDWKADWTESFRTHRWCYVFRRGPLGAALYSAKFGLGRLKEALYGR